jgi:hypothetical protein
MVGSADLVGLAPCPIRMQLILDVLDDLFRAIVVV